MRVDTAGRWLRRLPRAFPGKHRLGRALIGRARSRPAVLGDRDGNTLRMPNLEDSIGFYLWADGEYEGELLECCARHVTATSVVLDIGANVGTLTVRLARRVPQGSVIAFEANPQVLPFLRDNIAANHLTNVEIVPFAASRDGVDRVAFFVPPATHFGMGSSAAQFDVASIDVPACSVDRVVADRRLDRVDLVKVDVEGFEAHVFLGATQLLAGPAAPVIVFEFNDWAEERAFPGRRSWAQAILRDHGYAIWTLPAYLSGASPLQDVIRNGSHELVATKLDHT